MQADCLGHTWPLLAAGMLSQVWQASKLCESHAFGKRHYMVCKLLTIMVSETPLSLATVASSMYANMGTTIWIGGIIYCFLVKILRITV